MDSIQWKMDDLESWFTFALRLARHGVFYRWCDECDGGRRIVRILSGYAGNRRGPYSGKCDKYGRAMARTTDVGRCITQRSKAGSFAGCMCGFGFRWGKRRYRTAPYEANNVFTHGALASAGRFPVVRNQWSGVAMANETVD